jgi:hypothetical protein
MPHAGSRGGRRLPQLNPWRKNNSSCDDNDQESSDDEYEADCDDVCDDKDERDGYRMYGNYNRHQRFRQSSSPAAIRRRRGSRMALTVLSLLFASSVLFVAVQHKHLSRHRGSSARRNDVERDEDETEFTLLDAHVDTDAEHDESVPAGVGKSHGRVHGVRQRSTWSLLWSIAFRRKRSVSEEKRRQALMQRGTATEKTMKTNEELVEQNPVAVADQMIPLPNASLEPTAADLGYVRDAPNDANRIQVLWPSTLQVTFPSD